jgi:hypothetical protein
MRIALMIWSEYVLAAVMNMIITGIPIALIAGDKKVLKFHTAYSEIG